MKNSSDISAFQRILRESKNVIVVAGAGLSAASGIGTFRGAGGWWRKYDAMSLATLDAFCTNPTTVWKFYHYRREKALRAEPNTAHIALAKLAFPSLRSKVTGATKFCLITQNVDNLSPRAVELVAKELPVQNRQADSEIIEMHGRLFDVQCLNGCGWVEFNPSSPICQALQGTEDLVGDDANDKTISEADLPRCGKCNQLARPGVVWFGEAIPALPKIDSVVAKADLCLVVGTSSQVYPAAGIADSVKEAGGKVAVFNLERTPGDQQADFLFLGPCETTLPEALGFD